MRQTLLLSAAISVALLGAASAEQFRYATSQTPTNPNYTDATVPFAEAVAEDSEGNVEIELFPGGQLASTPATLAAVKDGTADAGLIVSNTVASDLRAINALAQSMFAGEDQVAVAGATAETILLNCPQCEEEMAAQGVMSRAPYALAPYYLMCTDPVPDLASLQGRRVRMAASAHKPLLEKIGATGLLIPAPETFEALERGQLDCTISPISWLVNYSLQDAVTHVVDLPLGMFRGMEAFAVNTDAWERMGEEGQAAVVANLSDLVARSVIYGSIEEDKRVREEVQKEGVQFVEPDEAFRAAVEEVAADEPQLVIEEAERRGVAGFADTYQTHLDLLEKWSEISAEVGTDPEKFAAALKEQVYDKMATQ